jgi:hypothetical protein
MLNGHSLVHKHLQLFRRGAPIDIENRTVCTSDAWMELYGFVKFCGKSMQLALHHCSQKLMSEGNQLNQQLSQFLGIVT